MPGFRVARPAPAVRHLVVTLAWTVLVWGLALGVLPLALAWIDRRSGRSPVELPGQAPLGALLLLAGGVLGLSAAWVMAVRGEGTPVPFDTARRLVVAGPYRVVRNPMAISAVVQATGVWLLLGSPLAALVPVGAAAVWQWVLRPREEAFLATRFGAQYDAYRSAVRCWVPGRPYRPAPTGPP